MAKKLFGNFTVSDLTIEQAFEKFQRSNKAKGLAVNQHFTFFKSFSFQSN